jgi:hypothetical protein
VRLDSVGPEVHTHLIQSVDHILNVLVALAVDGFTELLLEIG